MSARRTGRVIFVFGAALAALAIVVVGFIRPWERPADIRVGFLPIYVDLPLFVAEGEGYFEERGLTVEFVRFQSSVDIGAALATGRIDAGASIATHSALALEIRDRGLFEIFLVDAENPTNHLSSLVVRGDGSIATPADLEGRTIASFPGPTTQLWGPLALEALGVDVSQVTIIAMPIGGHISALESGTVDAIITYEPTATQAVMHDGAIKLVPGLIESNVIDPWQAGIWVLSSRFRDENPDVAAEFIDAIYEGVDFLRTNPIEAKQHLSEFTEIDLDVAAETPNIPFTKVWEADLETLQAHADLLTENGALSRRVMVEELMWEASPIVGSTPQ